MLGADGFDIYHPPIQPDVSLERQGAWCPLLLAAAGALSRQRVVVRVDQIKDQPRQQFFGSGSAEQRHGSGVDVDNPVLAVDDDGLGRVVHQGAVALLAFRE